MMKSYFSSSRAIIVIALFLLQTQFAHAFFQKQVGSAVIKPIITVITKNSQALPEKEILRFAELSQTKKGTVAVGKELGKLNLPKEVLADTYARIVIAQGKLSRTEAESMFVNLSNVPGFRTTLRKISGNNDLVLNGHLYELRVANEASKNGFKVVDIGREFSDGIKNNVSDIDVILTKGAKTFAIETKHYGVNTPIPVSKFRADMDTLVKFKNGDKNIIPVFSISHQPNNARVLKTLQSEAAKRDIQLVFGSPSSQIEQINMLGKIL